MSEVNFFSQLW